MHAQVKRIRGLPTLVIDGRPVPEIAYITYCTDRNCYEDFAVAGVTLYSVNLNFSEMPINERAPVLVFQKGIFENDAPDFSIVDRSLDQILAAQPNAYIFPRVNVNLSEAWEKAHPNELCEYGFGERRRVSFASDVWAEEVKSKLLALIEYIEQSPYAEHVIGYQIAGGNTEEWLPLDPNAAYGPRAKEKFLAYCEQNGFVPNEENYYIFASELVAGRVLEFAAVSKQATDRRKLVGAFYGYTLYVDRTTSHHALDKLLQSDDIDFLCSPVTYAKERAPGIDPHPMIPAASLRVHNKLYFSENDIRTHLSRPIHDHPNYTRPVWFGHEKKISAEQIKLSFCRALIHGYGMWWFDMWGGWYHDGDYMALMKRMTELCADGMDTPLTEIALFIDEKSYAKSGKNSGFVSETVLTLGLAGAPNDVYLASDFDKVYQNYKACIFAQPAPTALMTACIEKASAAGKASHIVTPDSGKLVAEELRTWLKKSGVTLLTEQNAVIYRGSRYLCFYATEDGEYDFSSDSKKEFVDLFTGNKITFPTQLSKAQCFLFRRSLSR